MEKAKIVHFAHVLGFAWVHYTAVELQSSYNPPGKAGERRSQECVL
jgi:hypothetical protein